MSKLTITGNIVAKPDHVDRVREELERLVLRTRREDGCLQYDLHQDNNAPTHFFLYENWASREQWRSHMAASPVSDFVTATQGAVEKTWVSELTHLL